MDTGGIDEEPNWYSDREEGGTIPPLLTLSTTMYYCEYENEKYDDGDIYNYGKDD